MSEQNLGAEFNRRLLEEKILEIIKNRDEITFDELRELLEIEGLYYDGLYIRRVVSDLIRRGVIAKMISSNRRNKFILRINE
ncbi:MAG: hypothetical protein QXE32_01000 [Sulfolobales archaeon]